MSLAATLTLQQAGRRTWPVVVIGAGPAGSFLARKLARAGLDVLLIDRSSFPRRKVCGCCLNGIALDLLDREGLGDLVADRGGVPLDRLHLGARNCATDLRLPEGAALSREAFDAALIETAIEAGAAFLPETTARVMPSPGGDVRSLTLAYRDGTETTVSARVVVGADGLAGQSLAHEPGHQRDARPGSRIGAGAVAERGPGWFEPGTIYMACGTGGYVGAVRLEDGRLDLAAALDLAHVRRRGGPGPAAGAILAEVGWPGADEAGELPWRGTPPLTRQAIRPAGERYFLAGDAAGYVEPFTGEGIAWALASATALAPLATRGARDWRQELAVEWGRTLDRLLGRRRFFCRLVTRLLRSPLLSLFLVRLLRLAPFVARPVLTSLNRPLRLRPSLSLLDHPVVTP